MGKYERFLIRFLNTSWVVAANCGIIVLTGLVLGILGYFYRPLMAFGVAVANIGLTALIVLLVVILIGDCITTKTWKGHKR